MYVQTYREQQQLQQENNQSPGPPAIPPDIQVSVCNLRIGPFQIMSFRPIKKIWFENWRNTCTGIKDHEGGGSLFPGLSHGLVPLGPQTGKNDPYYYTSTLQKQMKIFPLRVKHLPFHLPTTTLPETSWKTTARPRRGRRAFLCWTRTSSIPEMYSFLLQ